MKTISTISLHSFVVVFFVNQRLLNVIFRVSMHPIQLWILKKVLKQFGMKFYFLKEKLVKSNMYVDSIRFICKILCSTQNKVSEVFNKLIDLSHMNIVKFHDYWQDRTKSDDRPRVLINKTKFTFSSKRFILIIFRLFS